jgi:hypothetical protein
MTTMMLDSDHALAVARLDADLAAAAVTRELHDLRRRAIGAYEAALAHACGRPDDPQWRHLAQSVAAFLARIPAGMRSQRAASALARLNGLVRENLA